MNQQSRSTTQTEPSSLLSGRVALITGGTRGIGRAIAETYARHGAHVLVAGTNQELASEVVAGIAAAHGPAALPVHLDVGNPVQVQAAVQTALDQFGRLDILVNNAAVHRAYLVVDFPIEEWRELYRVNVEGALLCSQAAMRAMIACGHGGVLLHIASAAALKADLKHAAYSSSKAALVALSRILALEGGPHGIRSNCILPGATMTAMLQGVFESIPGIEQELIGKSVLGKLATVQDQANAALFLASDMASHITGEYLVVSGGEFMNA
jgi:NAD(P)-dependent dehydrogenase (short-subunit alcohol dehydrogenase family)